MSAATFPLAHPNQLRAARAIMDIFTGHEICYVLLNALLQAGKTGTFQSLATMALDEGLVDRVYILCGSNETLLRDQAEADTRYYNRLHFVNRRIKVVFRQDFPKTELNTHRALLIVDESHLDSGEGQMMSEFLGRHGLNLSGTTPTMLAQETYICSVSATPFAERSKMLDGTCPGKKEVSLEPGTGYVGLDTYKAAGKLLPTFDIKAEPERFAALLTASATPKWILFRCRNNAIKERKVRDIARVAGVRVLEYTSKRSEIAITADELKGGDERECMEAPPTVTTLVIVQGRLCVGKVVPKQHVEFVWENSADPKTDTLVQGLPGRMCGYALGAELPTIYVPASAIKERVRSVVAAAVDMHHGDSEIGRYLDGARGAEVVALHGTHLLGSRVALTPNTRAGLPVTQCPPILLDFTTEAADTDEADWIERADFIGRLRASALSGSEAQKAEMITYLEEASSSAVRLWTPKRRNLKSDTSSNHVDYFVSVHAAATSGTTPAQNVGAKEPPRLTFCIVHNNATTSPHWNTASAAGLRPGYVYAIFYTHAGAELPAVHTKSRVGTTRTDTVFDPLPPPPKKVMKAVAEAAATHATATAAATAVGGAGRAVSPPRTEGVFSGSLPEIVRTSPDALRSALVEIIKVWKRGTVTINPYISTFPLDRVAYHWRSKTDNDLIRILSELSPILQVRFGTAMDGRKDRGKPYFHVGCILWTGV